MAQSIPSVPSPPPGHLSGVCEELVILFWKRCKCPGWGPAFIQKPTVGLKNRVQIPHPRKTRKLYFPVIKLQIPFLWEISNNLIKKREAPYADLPLSWGRELMERKPHIRITLRYNYQKYLL